MLVASIRTRVSASPLAQRLAVGAAWSMGGVMAERALALVGSVAIVRLLGRDSFGQYAILQSTLTMVGVFAGAGLGVTATKYSAELKETDPERLGRILTLAGRLALASSVVIAGAVSAGSRLITARILNIPQDAGLLAMSSLSVLFNTLLGYQSGALIGFEAFKMNSLAGIGATLLSVPASIALTYLCGIRGAAFALVLTAAARWLLTRSMFASCLRHWRVPHASRGWVREWRAVVGFAIPALLSSVMVAPAHWVCHAMLINKQDGREQMAVLGVANQWYFAMLLLPAAAGRIVLPVLVSTVVAGQLTRSAKVLLLGVLANAAMVLPFTLTLGLGSPLIMKLYGASYGREWPVLATVVGTATLVAIQTPVGSMVAASSRMWLGMMMNLGWAAVYITGSRLLLGKGALGIAEALLCAYAIHSLWTCAFAARQLRAGRGPRR